MMKNNNTNHISHKFNKKFWKCRENIFSHLNVKFINFKILNDLRKDRGEKPVKFKKLKLTDLIGKG